MDTASLSLDLDNEWSYMQTNGDSRWSEFPSYLPAVVPRILDFFVSRDHKITFFVVGKDATIEENLDAIRSIADHGHEIGNHSFRHQPWLHEYSKDELNEELANAESALHAVTGTKPVGFRGPGYSYSTDTLEVLQSRGYEYDCSSFPNSVNTLSRIYFFSHSSLDASAKRQRGHLFGRPGEMFRRLKPYVWDLAEGPLLEIPVTTLPLFRFPIHFSYVLYLSKFSRVIAAAYFATAMRLCASLGVQPSLLLHPLDFMGVDDGCESIAFFPGMDMASGRKIDFLHGCLDAMEKSFELVTMREHARRIASSALPRRLPPTAA